MDIRYKLLFIHDENSEKSRQLKQAIENNELGEETHILKLEQVKSVLPIQAVPCMFLLGTDELLIDFEPDAVVDHFNFLVKKKETEQVVSDMANLLTEGGMI